MQLVNKSDLRKFLLSHVTRGIELQKQIKLMTEELNLIKVKLLNDLTEIGDSELDSEFGKAKIIEKPHTSYDTETLYKDFSISPDILEKYKKQSQLKFIQLFPKK